MNARECVTLGHLKNKTRIHRWYSCNSWLELFRSKFAKYKRSTAPNSRKDSQAQRRTIKPYLKRNFKLMISNIKEYTRTHRGITAKWSVRTGAIMKIFIPLTNFRLLKTLSASWCLGITLPIVCRCDLWTLHPLFKFFPTFCNTSLTIQQKKFLPPKNFLVQKKFLCYHSQKQSGFFNHGREGENNG